MSASLTLVTGLATSLWLVNHELQRSVKTQQLAHQITLEASMQMNLTLEFVLYGEPRALQQWERRRGNLDTGLGKLILDKSTMREAQSHLDNVSTMFDKLVAIRQMPQTDLLRLRSQLIINQLISSNQALLDLIYRWSETADRRRVKMEKYFHRFVAIYQASALLLIFMLAWVLYRRILQPLKIFHKAVLTVAKGDLSIRADTGTRDEIGDLSRTFDSMAIELVSQLKNEIREREAAEERLKLLATTDPLTGIFNRRHINSEARTLTAKVRRYHESLSLIMFDIDHFKQINDQYGHDAGDQVLIELVGIISEQIREIDMFARWGGEEFIILLPNTNAETALLLANRLRLLVETHSFGEPKNLTISVGVTSYHPPESVDSFFKRADEALYEAKNTGRNCVVQLKGISNNALIRAE